MGNSHNPLDLLPVANEKRLAVRVSDEARRWLRKGHPWLYEDSITYPFLLRDGVVISVNLPPDLTGTEAVRLSRFIESLSIDDTDSQRTTVPERDTRDDNS